MNASPEELRAAAQAFAGDCFGAKLAVLRHFAIDLPGAVWPYDNRRREPRAAPEDHVSRMEP